MLQFLSVHSKYKIQSILIAAFGFLSSFDNSTVTLAQQSINLHAKLSVGKKDNTSELLTDAQKLLNFAKNEGKLQQSLVMFLQNLEEQLVKLDKAKNTVQSKIKKEKAVSFTVGKYKLKELKKLRAKDNKKRAMTVMDVAGYEKKYSKKLEFSQPFMIKSGQKLFKDFGSSREKFNADQFSNNEYLEANTKMEYYPPDQPRQKIVGNQMFMTEPNMIPFSRYLTNCYLGTPAAPKIPGQATEHCELTVSATSMVENNDELDMLAAQLSDGTPIVDNVFNDWEQASQKFFSGNETEYEIKKILGKKESSEFIKQHASGNFRYFTFGPAGSGEKLHAENGLPFYDVLIHGYRRWLLLKEDELQKVANKAREALEFQQTSAYMFFEEKLPELREEFGLKSYIEVNQEPGDVVFVPPGWFRVSLSLADSISYYEQMLYQPHVVEAIVRNTIWNPSYRQFNLAFCYDTDDVVDKLKSQEVASSDRLDEKSYAWIAGQMSQVEDAQYPGPLMNVLVTCAKILSSAGKISNLVTLEKTKCSAQVWTDCRGQLMKKMSKKKLKLNWLPETIGDGGASEKKEEVEKKDSKEEDTGNDEL